MHKNRHAQSLRQVLNSFKQQQPMLFELDDADIDGLPPKTAAAVSAARAKTAAVAGATRAVALREPTLAVPAAPRSRAAAPLADFSREKTATVSVVGFNHDADEAFAGQSHYPAGAPGAEIPDLEDDGCRDAETAQYVPPRPRIKIFGVGGAGNNIVDDIAASAGPGGVPDHIEFWQLNTDAMHLGTKRAPAKKILLTPPGALSGHGTGGDPLLGKSAAEAGKDDLSAAVRGADVCVIVAGMGKGTGTGASPVLAKLARDCGAITLAFATLPSLAEGKSAAARATQGLAQLAAAADAVCTIDNETALFGCGQGIGAAYAAVAREVGMAIKTVARLVLQTSYQNIDLADVRAFFRRRRAAKAFTVFRGTMPADGGPEAAAKAVQTAARRSLFEQRFRGAGELLVHLSVPQSAPSQAIRAALNAARELTANEDASVVSAMAIAPDGAPVAFEVVSVREGDDLAAAAATDAPAYQPPYGDGAYALFPREEAPARLSLPAARQDVPTPAPARYAPRSARFAAGDGRDDDPYASGHGAPEDTDGPALEAASADFALDGAEAEFDQLLGTRKLPGDGDTDDVRREITRRMRGVYGATARTPDGPAHPWRRD